MTQLLPRACPGGRNFSWPFPAAALAAQAAVGMDTQTKLGVHSKADARLAFIFCHFVPSAFVSDSLAWKKVLARSYMYDMKARFCVCYIYLCAGVT